MAKWKSLKLCDLLDKKYDDDVQDRISVLPDEIVVHILSYLTIRRAVVTSALSKRWRYTWMKVPELKFNAKSMYSRELSYVEQRLKTLEFVRWVDRVIDQLIGPSLSISAFSVCYELTEAVVANIDRWVSFALERNVQILNLHLGKGRNIRSWLFPPKAASERKLLNLRHLHLGGCQLVPCFGSFKNLSQVYLTNVVTTDEAFEDLLSSCLLLEELLVYSAKNLTNVRVPVSLVKLRAVQIYLCSNLQRMEVNAVNLVSFLYIGAVISFSFNNISKLQVLRVCWVDDVLSRLMSRNLQLNTLILDFDIAFGVDLDFKLLPALTNLKVLILYIKSFSSGFVGFTNLLIAAPSLSKLYLECVDSPALDLDVMVTEKFHHKGLREIKLSGFSSQTGHIKLALFLIESAVALEKITLVPYHQRWYLRKWQCEKPNPEQVDAVRNCASQISSKLPSTAKLEILDC